MGKPLAGTTLKPVSELLARDKKPGGERVNCHTTVERMWLGGPKPGHRGALAGSVVCSAVSRLEFTWELHPVLSSSDVFQSQLSAQTDTDLQVPAYWCSSLSAKGCHVHTCWVITVEITTFVPVPTENYLTCVTIHSDS